MSIFVILFFSEQSKFADLNDPNRALKVGEMYSQLYDNQWMEAYQYLDNIMNLREDKILEILQRIIRVYANFLLFSKVYDCLAAMNSRR